SVNIDLFAPAEERAMAPQDAPVRIAAMLRPSTPRRAPERTVRVLDEVKRRFGDRVSIESFGSTDDELEQAGLYRADFTNHGPLHPAGMARLLGHSEIFIDLSDYQAMGLTLLEAMASGCAVLGPATGGANSFLRDGVNGILA